MSARIATAQSAHCAILLEHAHQQTLDHAKHHPNRRVI